jgi:hypothetical protein
MTGVCTRVLWQFTTKPSGYLVELQNQDQRLDRQRRDPDAQRSFEAEGHATGSQVLGREDMDCVEGMDAL